MIMIDNDQNSVDNITQRLISESFQGKEGTNILDCS